MLGPRKVIVLGGKRLHPLRLPALHAWYTFDDSAYLYQDAAMTTAVAADGDPIGAVLDRSGNGRHCTQATADDRPTWRTNIKNGRGVARLDGTDWLGSTAPGGLLRNVPGATLIAYGHTTYLTGADINKHFFVLERGGASAGTRAFLTRSFANQAGSLGTGGRRLDTDAFAAINSNTNTFANAEWGLQAGRLNYTTQMCYLYYKNVLLKSEAFGSAGNTSDTDPRSWSLGAHNGTGIMEGDLAEIIVCGADIGDTLLTRLWTEYLSPKWEG